MSGALPTDENWARFFGRDHTIYVSPRHLEAHFERIGADIQALLADRDAPRVLDYGCGDALAAPALAAAGVHLTLFDAVPAVAARLKSRFGDGVNPRILDDAAFQALPRESVDVVLMNSVAQYLSRDALGRLLDRFRGLLAPGGEIILGDIVPPQAGMRADVGALLTSAARHGFLGAAITGLVRTAFSDYRRLRRELGLTTYDEAEIIALCEDHGLLAVRAPRNIGFNQHRMTLRARPRAR